MSDKNQATAAFEIMEQGAEQPIRKAQSWPNAWAAKMIARCEEFAKAAAKHGLSANPSRAPFIRYTKAADGSPLFTGDTAQMDAQNVALCTVKHLRRMRIAYLRVEAKQLPNGAYGVFAFRTGTKARKLAGEVNSF
jgi:hypothetical protein